MNDVGGVGYGLQDYHRAIERARLSASGPANLISFIS
jgi:hypothetical protein